MSDLHVGHEDMGDRFRWIARRLIQRYRFRASLYVIVITGDLVDHASVQLCMEVKSVIDTLQDAGFRVLVVPGNHDYGTGNRGDKQWVPRFSKIFHGCEVEHPKVDIIGKVAFIGLDSMAAELRWYDRLWANGELGSAQLKRLRKVLLSDDVRDAEYRVVYLHHHPFDAMPLHELSDSDDLRKTLLDTDVDVLLYGHNHQGRTDHGSWGIPRCYDAGTATGKTVPGWIERLAWFRDMKMATRCVHIDEPIRRDHELDLL